MAKLELTKEKSTTGEMKFYIKLDGVIVDSSADLILAEKLYAYAKKNYNKPSVEILKSEEV